MQWYVRLTTTLNFKWYSHSLNDYLLFFKKSAGKVTIIAVYVDDILITGDDLLEQHRLKEFLNCEFKIKDIGQAHYFLGMEIIREEKGFILTQKRFTSELLTEFGVLDLKATASPIDPTQRLSLHTGDLILDPTFYQ